MNKKIIAIMYDFDKTLCTKDMQEYSFIPNLGISPKEFWEEADNMHYNNSVDAVLTYMYLMNKKTLELNHHITREYLNKMGYDIELFPGLDNWFKNINEYANKLGYEVEHYIISSGLKEIIEGSKISNNFKEIYASEFLYDDNNYAVWPKMVVNYTNKTQFLFRINKGILDITNDLNINMKIDEDNRRIPFKNMIYIGDGYTDIPCMKITKDNGGSSIAVYTSKNIDNVKSLYSDNRINYIAKADYSENGELDLIVKQIIKNICN